MNSSETLLVVLLVQQLMLATCWWAAGRRLGLSKASSAHWSSSALAAALSALWPLLPLPGTGDWQVMLVDLSMLAALLFLSLGMSAFFKRPLSGREPFRVLGLALAISALPLFLPSMQLAAQLCVGLLMAAVTVRCLARTFPPVQTEFGRFTAFFVSAPLGLGALSVAGLWGSLHWGDAAQAGFMAMESSLHRALLLALMVASLWLGMMQGYMVLMRLVHRLRYLSLHDALTGLFNRRAIEEKLAQELRLFRRRSVPFAVMVVDVDHFKRINDTWGHAAGDRALTRLADVLRRCVRETDDIGRLGGEEFCVLARGAQVAGALEVAERIREGVQELMTAAGSGQKMSVSIGLTCVEGQVSKVNGGQLVDRADRALYVAKQTGRNRVVLFTPDMLHSGEEASSPTGHRGAKVGDGVSPAAV